jgi:hypothetical protein
MTMPFEDRRVDDDFLRVRRRAWFRDVMAKLAGRPNMLLSYQEVKDSLQLGGPIYRGVKQVPIAQIIGSVDRYRDFDDVFLPAHDRTANRWKSIARAYYQDIDLPPVRLYKVGEAYFVLDGHHRVSVAREQGIEFIDAEVQEVVSRVPVTADLKSEDLKVLHEYRRFLERTRLDDLRPEQRIRFTVAGGYDRVIEHIAMHRHFMQVDQQREVSEQEAVCDWYDTVYLPIVEVVGAHHILADFPSRTESDLYLWIVEHLHYLRQCEQDISIEQAAEDYVDQFSERPVRKLERAFKQAFSELPHPELTPEQIETQPARQRFLDQTRLDAIRPGHGVQCTVTGGYDRVIEHVHQHRYFMGLDLKRDVSEEEATGHWYDEIYLPIVAAIREHNLLTSFPGLTETDLYLSIIDYLDQLRKTDGSVTIDEAAINYAAHFKQHPIKKIVDGLRQALGIGRDESAELAPEETASV